MLRASFDQRNALGRLEFDVPVFKREKVQNRPPPGKPRYLVPASLHMISRSTLFIHSIEIP